MDNKNLVIIVLGVLLAIAVFAAVSGGLTGFAVSSSNSKTIALSNRIATKEFSFDDTSYKIELLSATTERATFSIEEKSSGEKVQKEIQEGYNKIILGLNVYLVRADSNNLAYRATFKISEQKVTYAGVLEMLSECTRSAIEVNTSDPYWQSNSQPTGNSLCSNEGKKCVVSLITKVTLSQRSPPKEWGENTDPGLWPCSWDATSVYGRSSWPIYRMDAICC